MLFKELNGSVSQERIVLVDEIDQQIESCKEPPTAILDSTVSRVRSVVTVATTTASKLAHKNAAKAGGPVEPPVALRVVLRSSHVIA